MKKTLRMLVLMLAALLTTGCAGSAVQPTETQPAATEEATTAPQETETAALVRTLPLLSIETAAQGEDALAFVTEPVAAHVAESIASWTPRYVMPPAPWYETCTVTLTDADENVLLQAEADVKVRGNWTTSYPKKPLRVKFSEKQSIPGLHEGKAFKNWLLLAEYKDGSMLRNQAALSIARKLLEPDGLYAADTELVEVEINGEYWGVYLLTEQQQVQAERVAVTEPEKDYGGTDIGYFLEFDGYYTDEDALHGFFVDYADNAPLLPFDGTGSTDREICPLNTGGKDLTQDVGISVKSEIYSQEQHDFIAAYVNNVYRILYAAAYEDRALVLDTESMTLTESGELTPQEAVEAAVDVQSLADLYILSELTCDADIYWSSFFMDVDLGADGDGKLRFEAPWDFDSSMGNKDRCADGTGFYAANIVPDVNDTYETINPWLAVLMHETWFQEIIREKWTKAYDAGIFSDAAAEIRADSAAHTDAFARNYERWDNLRHNEAAHELARQAAACRTQEEAASYLADWLEKRIAFLDEYWHKSE